MSFWQLKEWWELLVKSKQVEKIIYIEDILIEKRSIWLGKYGLFCLWLEINKLQINKLKSLEEKLVDLCKKEDWIFIQIETINNLKFSEKLENAKLDYSHPELVSGWQRIFFSLFKPGYYKKFITPYTALIDLKKSEDEILSLMKPKWRYNIKVAIKNEVIVDEVEKTKENIKIFYKLMQETTIRDSFNWNKLNYYIDFLETIKSSKLLIAKKDWIWIAAWIFVIEKDYSIYYYWSSTSDNNYRNLMAPYLLQWTAIKKAKAIWSKYYDFLWIATPWDLKSVLLWVTDFKLKFTQNIINVSDSYIYVNNMFIYYLVLSLRLIKKIVKK